MGRVRRNGDGEYKTIIIATYNFFKVVRLLHTMTCESAAIKKENELLNGGPCMLEINKVQDKTRQEENPTMCNYQTIT